jgi:hypothetical protein
VTLLHAGQHLPAVHSRHHHVEEDQVGRLLLERGEALLAARGLTHGVALELEAGAHKAAQARVVVDDQHQRPALRAPARPGAVEEGVEVAATVAPVLAGRVEGRQATHVGPLADRALRNAEVLRGLAKREPFGLLASGSPRAGPAPVDHGKESIQTSCFLTGRATEP